MLLLEWLRKQCNHPAQGRTFFLASTRPPGCSVQKSSSSTANSAHLIAVRGVTVSVAAAVGKQPPSGSLTAGGRRRKFLRRVPRQELRPYEPEVLV